jgi:2-oxoglutarate dehydrogenase E2 component (dihydrolipoamide succinyltransferase)
MMKEQGISSDAINGSGRGGRITKSDVVEHMNQPQQPAQPAEQPQPEAKQAPQQQPQQAQQQQQQPAPQQAPQGTRNEWREKMTPLRRTLANRLVSVKNETAMLTTFNEVDMSGIMELRNRYKDTFKDKHGFKLGFMGFFTMASCRALLEFPQVNAYIDEDTYELVYHDYCDVGVAVSTERGLVVPVIRSAESLTLTQIEYEINNLAQKARDNKITIPEMTGGTFTISNGGVFGSLLSTPILNPPQSAILGMHRTDERPVAINGEVKIRPMMYVALSYDHRVVDGKESVSFLYRIKEYLEDPARMLLDI